MTFESSVDSLDFKVFPVLLKELSVFYKELLVFCNLLFYPSILRLPLV